MKKNNEEFTKNIEKYIKHNGLEIVFTLKNGQRVAVNGKRELVNNEVIQYYGNEPGIIIPLTEIQSADVYAL